MSKYPPRDLPVDVRLFDHGGLPVSVGWIPDCPFYVALWGGESGPERFGSRATDENARKDPGWVPSLAATLIDEVEFRQLITINGAWY